MFLEYNWTALCYQVRFGDTFIAWRGQWSFETFNAAKAAIEQAGCKIGRKTDSRTWAIENGVPLDRLRYHVSGAIARGEKEAITEKR